MGVFDFLYKSPRSKTHPRHYHHGHQQYRRPTGQPGGTPGHHKQRITTHVNKNSELPIVDSNKHERSLSYNQQRIRPKINKNLSVNDAKTRIYRQNQSSSIDVDDFTRLSRLENKIDSYITRYNEIADELDNIRTNLNLIQKEFKQEYDDDIIGGKKNKHVVEIGDRILAKLDSFKINESHTSPVLSLSQTPEPFTDEIDDKPNKTALKSDDDGDDHKAKQTKSKFLNLSLMKRKSQNKYDQKTPTTTATTPTSPERVPITLNGMMVPPQYNPLYTMAHASYAIVDNDENGVDLHNKTNMESIPEHEPALYTSTPSTKHPNQESSIQRSYIHDEPQSPSFASQRISPVRFVDGITAERPVYINMSSRLRSEHPIIEHCLRRIESLRPLIMRYNSEHKFRVYKEFNEEIFNMMNELNDIDCSKDSLFANDKNVALCELHNLAGVLERSIQCKDNDCVICNSFMYKPEVSV
ncbi:hypothetical protein DERP_011501 [Dermatophagoides pteronyssinus]|uniref:Cep57 centrosome microtubule-binding domain-containing protein n=1 Tax=Dermatophagoides pteronyssinus TaxID=6956 RepID=A0ABQ8JCM6_DERPT|nr:hypothetical protein DERP_011501 [Dermatophagoides pteronyssinus]